MVDAGGNTLAEVAGANKHPFWVICLTGKITFDKKEKMLYNEPYQMKGRYPPMPKVKVTFNAVVRKEIEITKEDEELLSIYDYDNVPTDEQESKYQDLLDTIEASLTDPNHSRIELTGVYTPDGIYAYYEE